VVVRALRGSHPIDPSAPNTWDASTSALAVSGTNGACRERRGAGRLDDHVVVGAAVAPELPELDSVDPVDRHRASPVFFDLDPRTPCTWSVQKPEVADVPA